MRLLVLSDIHLEFGPFALPDDLGEFDAAVFAGDIGRPITAGIRWIEQQLRGPLKGRPVIFVPGNHEFYHDEIYSGLRSGRELAEQTGIHMLAPGCVVLGGVRFIGATLWTDFNLFGETRAARLAARHGMNEPSRCTASPLAGREFGCLQKPERDDANFYRETARRPRRLAAARRRMALERV